MKIYVNRILKLGLAISVSVSLTACDLSQIAASAQAASNEVSSKSTSSESSSDSSSTSAAGVSAEICDVSLTDFSSVQSELSSFLSGLLSSLQSKESSAADDKALERIQNLEEKVSNDLAIIDDATELTSEVQSVIDRVCNSRHGKKGRAPDNSKSQNSCSAVEDLAKLSFSERQGKLIDRLNEFLAQMNSNDERSERIFADLDVVKTAASATDEYVKIERRAFCPPPKQKNHK